LLKLIGSRHEVNVSTSGVAYLQTVHTVVQPCESDPVQLCLPSIPVPANIQYMLYMFVFLLLPLMLLGL
jgi:hypothetical protein